MVVVIVGDVVVVEGLVVVVVDVVVPVENGMSKRDWFLFGIIWSFFN